MEQDKSWDLNIFFREDWTEEEGTTVSDNLIINPCVYVITDGEFVDHIYTDILIDCTYAETRYIASQRPVHEYGEDWFETLPSFLAIAPPRIQSLLATLPDPYTVT